MDHPKTPSNAFPLNRLVHFPLTLVLFLTFLNTSSGQTLYETLQSGKLRKEVKIKIQLPRKYYENKDKSYPLIVVLDGDYLFEPMAGNVDFMSYWEEMPEAMVVGIMQEDRELQTTTNTNTNYPDDEGRRFFEFVGMELMPFLNTRYRLANFNVVAGHDLTANFINFYLLKPNPLFNGYISLSPTTTPQMLERLSTRLKDTKYPTFYYLATGSEDPEDLRENCYNIHHELAILNNENVKYYFDDFDDVTHYTLVSRAIPQALIDLFGIFRPITKKEYNEVILNLEKGEYYDYIDKKYKLIKELYSLNEKVRYNDLVAVSQAMVKVNDWKGLKRLSALAKEHYPGTVLSPYYEGLSLEGKGDYDKAYRTYQAAYILGSVGNIDREVLLERAGRIKQKYGY
ncbi:MAG: alpha/beta hydrolase-fold protein [Leeuwenhoekiella sp.]